jgi:hypothetical protein
LIKIHPQSDAVALGGKKSVQNIEQFFRASAFIPISPYWFTCTTVAGGKPLKYVEEAWL